MSAAGRMLVEADVRERARKRYGRNWREWAQGLLLESSDGGLELSVDLKPPRERDLSTREAHKAAREWVDGWRACRFPDNVEWETRAWPSVGEQRVPSHVRMHGAREIAMWAGQGQEWNLAVRRIGELQERLGRYWHLSAAGSTVGMERIEDVVAAVKSSVSSWCALEERDWHIALDVLTWLLGHPQQRCYVRQLPIRGIDTKWIERHGSALRALYEALAGRELSFEQPAKQFRCKACSERVQLAGCDDFALSAAQLARLAVRPRAVLVCENLVNVLCAPHIEDVLAVHGCGYAVRELRSVGWLSGAPVVYWGDLDSNGFAILSMLRGFAPHARSVMMDAQTLQRYRDLCVEEPQPVPGELARLTADEQEALRMLRQGNLRLEQERIEWSWAAEQLQTAFAQ